MAKKKSKKSNKNSKESTTRSASLRHDDVARLSHDASRGPSRQPIPNVSRGKIAPQTRPLLPSFPGRGHEIESGLLIPHRGSLCRIDSSVNSKSSVDYLFVIEIRLENGSVHELRYQQQHFEFMSRLFAILDSESRGSVGRTAVMEFVTLRCPVFWRRDNDLRRLGELPSGSTGQNSPTFDEVWNAVATCSSTTTGSHERVELGVAGWMVFCRFIALAQYLEAKRRFSARHLQQTMRHRNSPRGSEVVVVDVPPPEPPAALSPSQLAEYERKVRSPLPLPELDLDHTLVAARDVYTYHNPNSSKSSPGKVQISVFGSPLIPSPLVSSSSTTSFSSSNLEFAVTYTPGAAVGGDGSWGSLSMENIVVRRSFDDLKWLNDTFSAHKALGGTLCGRILPPFPSSSSVYQTDDAMRSSSTSGTGGAKMAIEAAAAGVDLLTSVAKSFWGSYLTPSSSVSTVPANASSTTASAQTGKKGNPRSLAVSDNYYSASSPVGKARQLERYLNYLLEHPALSTSFALNTILKASQSGLEAAKHTVRDHAKAVHQQQSHAPQLDNGKLSLLFWPSSQHQTGSPESVQPNLSWVRTAAQAAMALKVHGILETTGMPSASARLQHASLPVFETASKISPWMDDEDRQTSRRPSRQDPADNDLGLDDFRNTGQTQEPESFESGVVEVESELGASDGGIDASCEGSEGYDLLPLPVPAPERRILCEGSSSADGSRPRHESKTRGEAETGKARFHYGTPSRRHRLHLGDLDEAQPALLGDFAVDDDIDKLREVIGSVDNTLSRCLAACGGINGARRKTLSFHLDVVRGFDSWEGLRGKFIAQRALLKGVSGLEQSRDVSEESDLELIDDISWQSSLASSAVSAAEDVRSTVRAARTAASAKTAADAASLTARNACENGKFSSIDEARAAQTRASIAQSHAIHAAVVEHEAKTAKRRAALALAHDVKCWNVHRKRELLRTCLRSTRSQLEASRRAVDAWSCLRDGYVGSPVVPFSDTRRANYTDQLSGYSEESATIFSDAIHKAGDDAVEDGPSILAVDHNLLSNIETNDPGVPEGLSLSGNEYPEEVLAQPAPTRSSWDAEVAEPETFAPLCTGEPPPSDNAATMPAVDNTQNDIGEIVSSSEEVAREDGDVKDTTEDNPEENEKLSASMQSLVDGLMAWGGQYDSEDDVALPTGMAASIAFEESGLMGS